MAGSQPVLVSPNIIYITVSLNTLLAVNLETHFTIFETLYFDPVFGTEEIWHNRNSIKIYHSVCKCVIFVSI